MKRTLFSRALRTFAAIAVVAGFGATELQAEPDVEARRNRRGFNLFASSTVVLIGNRVQCGLDNQGNTCTDVFGSPTGGGGFWPKNTPNQYIFNGGLQLAGILPGDLPVWAGDTVGAYIFDARGTQPQGEQLTLIYNSLDAGDVATWPSGAFIRDGNVYNPALLGRLAISQQDSWVRYWDGSPALLSGRTHPMGIMIEQRTLAWNFPAGNEDIIYVIYDFVNITSADPASYEGLRVQCEASKALASDPAVQGNIDCDAYKADVAAIGAQYQAGIADRLGVNLPNGGYRIDQLYASFSIDPDVGNAGTNSSTAILPFDMGVAYKSDFSEPTWFYPPDINGAPFGPWPGYVGVKYLKSPIDPGTGNQVGLTLFSNTENGATAFPDPTGVSQLWRYLSGNVTAIEGDRVCSQPNPIANKLCFLVQTPIDTRFYQASGPFSLNPGEGSTIVVAFVHAAPIAAPIIAFGGGAGIMAPGIPASGTEIFQDVNALNPAASVTLRPLDYSAGWVGHADIDGNFIITQDEVIAAPRSLLAKSLVAQGIFDANFLLPFAPEPPVYYLVPGDNQVTVIWSPSTTETVGDPYFAIASDVTSALFDPNYRNTDVEGYRVYRGRTGADLVLLAQFDYAGTNLSDFNGSWDYGSGCAPELGPGFDGSGAGQCPINFSGGGFGAGDPSVDHDIVGDMPQVSLPGRAALLTGGTLLLEGKLDTFWPDFTAGGGPALDNAGVPFAYIDTDVINSTDYFYAVTAYDVNSVNSGPSSLESAVIPTRTTPRAPAMSTVDPPTVSVGLISRGVVLPTGPNHTIDPITGTFSGPAAPANTLTNSLQVFLPDMLAQGRTTVRIDSVVAEYYHNGTYFVTVTAPDGSSYSSSYGPAQPLGPEQEVAPYLPIAVPHPADPTVAAAQGFAGLPTAGLATTILRVDNVLWQSRNIEWHVDVDGAFFTGRGITDRSGGSRWFEGANETMADPTLGYTWGSLTGVTAIVAPRPYIGVFDDHIRRPNQASYHVWRAADMTIYWGAGGTVDSVIDKTHNLEVPFNTQPRGTWGFVGDYVTDGNKTAVTGPDGLLSYFDWPQGPCFNPAVDLPNWTEGPCLTAGVPTENYLSTATLMPTDVNGDGVSDGPGIGIYIVGEFFLMNMAALPAAGTEWTLRTYNGYVTRDATSNEYSFLTAPPRPGPDTEIGRPASVTGLEAVVEVSAPGVVTFATGAASLENVHTVPDPYYVTSSLEVTSSQKVIKFVNLPPQANIRIYSVSGVLVDVIDHDNIAGGGEAVWDVRNRNGQFVASGVYFFHVEAADGSEKVGRFTVVNSSGINTGGAR